MNENSPSAPRLTDADAKRARLAQAKALAAALLVLAVAVLVIARLYPQPSYVAALVRAAAEAAIVGGLADWFAVTALFRHPLGLPIPHTALVPHRKDEIGRSLGHFVSDQFLAPELLIARLRQRNRALQIARALDTPEIADFIAGRLMALVPMALSSANDAELRRFFAQLAREGLKRLDLRPTIDAVVDAIVRRGRHMALADTVLDMLAPAIAGLRTALVSRIGERTGRFFPAYLDRKIADELILGVIRWLAEARTPGTEERQRLEAWLMERISTLRAAPDYPAMIQRAQAALLSNPALAQSFEAIWDELKRELAADAKRAEPRLGALARQLVRTLGRLLQESPAVQQHFNTAIEGVLVNAIAPWRRAIGSYIAEIVASWDGRKVAEVIELQVGRDLQYIRVNGTLVGALIGSGLFLLGSGLPVLRRFLMSHF